MAIYILNSVHEISFYLESIRYEPNST